MKPDFENIREIVQQVVDKYNLLLIDFVVRGSESNRVIEVFIDGEKNISADECALASREISRMIDELNLLKSYRLDVSSPGVERPLIYLKQFPKHIDRMFEVEFKTLGSLTRIKGRLIAVEDEVLTFQTEKEIKIKHTEIIKAKVLVSFN
jgi:ribosome maturation factor RimP